MLRELTPHILIVGGSAPRVQAGGVRVVADRLPGAGALGGLYSALLEAPTEQVLVIACDMPFVTAPFLARLAALGVDGDAVVDATVPLDARGLHPLCASYARGVAGRLQARLESGRLRVVEALSDLQVRHMGPDELTPFDPDGRLLLNINTPDDYVRARSLS